MSDIKLIANNVPRVLYVNAREGKQIRTVQLQSGLNQVKKKDFDLIKNEPGFNKMVDDGTVSLAGGDISAAKDVSNEARKSSKKRATKKKVSAKNAPKPVTTGNQRDQGAPILGQNLDAAVKNAPDGEEIEAKDKQNATRTASKVAAKKRAAAKKKAKTKKNKGKGKGKKKG